MTPTATESPEHLRGGGREQHHSGFTEVETEAQGIMPTHPKLGHSAQHLAGQWVASSRPGGCGLQRTLGWSVRGPRALEREVLAELG